MAKAKKSTRAKSTRPAPRRATSSEPSYIVQFGVVFIVVAAIVISYIVGMRMSSL